MKLKKTRVIQLKPKSSLLIIVTAAAATLATAAASWLWYSNDDQTYWAVAEPATVGANLDELTLVQVPADFGLTKSHYLSGSEANGLSD